MGCFGQKCLLKALNVNVGLLAFLAFLGLQYVLHSERLHRIIFTQDLGITA